MELDYHAVGAVVDRVSGIADPAYRCHARELLAGIQGKAIFRRSCSSGIVNKNAVLLKATCEIAEKEVIC